LVIAAVLVRGQFFAPATSLTRHADNRPMKPELYADWTSILPHGTFIGDTGAPIKIIEFVDFQCGFCGRSHRTIREIAEEHGASIAAVLVHLPLKGHTLAVPAANAAECAQMQGQFAEFVDALFDKQDSLGLKTWTSYARDGGIGDLARFERCVESIEVFPKVEAGLTLAERLGVRSTPTVSVNGCRFAAPPTSRELSQAVVDLLAGREPYWEQQ